MSAKSYVGLAGTDKVIRERNRQVELGYDPTHDSENHTPEELMRISACYLDFAATWMEDVGQDQEHPFWPETTIPWKPEATPELTAIKGAAFAMAALDLLEP